MNHITLFNIVLLLCGFVIHFLYALLKITKMKLPFQVGFYFKDNWIEMLLTIVCGFTLLLIQDDVIKLLHIQADDSSSLPTVYVLLCGIFPMFIFQKLFKLIGAAPNE